MNGKINSKSAMIIIAVLIVILCIAAAFLISPLRIGSDIVSNNTSVSVNYKQMNVVANYSNKGQTVYLSKGSTLTVVLDGSYWRIYNASNSSVLQQANSSVLQQVGKVGYGSGECSGFQPPGSGCGTVTKTFLSVGIGTANITAYRGSCGEALRCVNGTGNYSVRVVVTG